MSVKWLTKATFVVTEDQLNEGWRIFRNEAPDTTTEEHDMEDNSSNRSRLVLIGGILMVITAIGTLIVQQSRIVPKSIAWVNAQPTLIDHYENLAEKYDPGVLGLIALLAVQILWKGRKLPKQAGGYMAESVKRRMALRRVRKAAAVGWSATENARLCDLERLVATEIGGDHGAYQRGRVEVLERKVHNMEDERRAAAVLANRTPNHQEKERITKLETLVAGLREVSALTPKFRASDMTRQQLDDVAVRLEARIERRMKDVAVAAAHQARMGGE